MRKNTGKSIKKRNAVSTRAAILASAQNEFARYGYDRAGVREIAAGAGVTAMMVNRYFGSKEELFAEVVTETMKDPTVLSASNIKSDQFATAMVRSLVEITKSHETPLIGFQIFLRSFGSDVATKIGRKMIEGGHQKTMTKAIGGKHAAERAAIIISLIAGFQMMRQMLAISGLADAKEKDLIRILEPIFVSLVEG